MNTTHDTGPVKQPHYSDVPENVFDAQLSEEMIKRTNKINDASIDLAVRLKQAREFIAWSVHHIRGLWLDWVDESGEISKNMTMFRMAFERESKLVTAHGKDMKEFFNSPDYIASHERLKEMLSMLDRFAEYKKDGTLDAFADFILKVSCNSPSKS